MDDGHIEIGLCRDFGEGIEQETGNTIFRNGQNARVGRVADLDG